MSSDIEKWMRSVEQTLVELDRRIRNKPSSDPSAGYPPTGAAGGDLTGTYPNPSIAAGAVTGGAGGKIADGTITHVDIAAANKDGAAATPSMRTLGTGATQAAAGNDPRLSDARPPTAHTHSASEIVSGTLALARIPTGTTVSTVALGSHTHTLSDIVAGGTMNAPLVMVDRTTIPGSIPAGSTALYFKVDGKAYTTDASGVERPLIPVPDQLHTNPSLDNVASSTTGNANTNPVPARMMPTGWSWFWSAGATSRAFADETVTLNGVGWSARSDMPNSGDGQSYSSSIFTVVPGSLITVSAWVRGNGPYASLSILTSAPMCTPDLFSGCDSTSTDSAAIVPTSTWQKLTMSFIVPAGHTKARFMMRGGTTSFGGTAGSLWWDETESSMQITPPAQVLTGSIQMWPTNTPPTGYLLCNGGTFSSDTYPTLAAILGDTFGTHSGTTYYLPDFRGRSPVGVGTASPAVGGKNYTLGMKHGDERLATHTHTATDSGHRHALFGQVGVINVSGSISSPVAGGGTYGFAYVTSGNEPIGYASISVSDHNLSKQTVNSGNVHPVLGINYIIKT